MNAYQVLGVPQAASQTEIDLAYEVLYRSLRLFASTENIRRFTEVAAAYALLSNPTTRRQLDEHGGEFSTGASRPEGDRTEGLRRISQDSSPDQSLVSHPMTNCNNTTTYNYYSYPETPGYFHDNSRGILWPAAVTAVLICLLVGPLMFM